MKIIRLGLIRGYARVLNILIADDDSIIRQGLRKVIENKASDDFCVVSEATDGEIALERLKELKVDVLITDIKMPIMDGIELIKKINEAKINIKVVALSGFDDYKYVREALKYGAIDYLLKPIDKQSFIELLYILKDQIEEETQKKNSELLHQNMSLDGISLLKEKLLFELIKGNDVNFEKYNIKFGSYELSDFKLMMMTIISVDYFYKIKNTEKILSEEMLKSKFKKEVLDYFSFEEKSGLYTIIVNREDEIIVLFMACDMEADLFNLNICNALNDFNDFLAKNKGYTVTVGKSKIFYNPYDSHKAYHQSMYALKRRFYDGRGIIDYTPEVSCYSYFDIANIKEQIAQILNYVEIGESINAKKSAMEVLKAISMANVEPDQFKETCSNILTKVINISDEFRSAFTEGYSENKFNFFSFIKEVDTFEELYEQYGAMFYNVTEINNAIRRERSKKVIERSKDYIKRHYCENLSLNTLANYAKLHPFYFSTLFKNETGKSFTDFLIETRINEAKKLLINPGIKIYEIGQMVGYEESVSFSRVFKKVVGISPIEYRKILK